MAKIGLKYPVYKGENAAGRIAKAIQADITVETNDATLYADDGVAETDKSFRRGTITLGLDDLPDEAQVALLGHTKDDNGEITAHYEDAPPYVGIGFYGTKVVNNQRKYRAIWLPRVQFAEPSDTHSTQGENLAFSTPTITGTIMTDDTGVWKQEQTFTTESDAIEYINEKAGISSGT